MFSSKKKTRGQLMRAELGSSWDHFVQAATHAAGGVGATVGPSAGKVSGVAKSGWGSTMSAFAPLAAAYREGAQDATAIALKAKKAQKKGSSGMSGKKTAALIGLLAAGAAVGAAGALVIRRRRRQQWSEYDPTGALDSVRSDAKSMTDKFTEKSDSAIDKVSHHASKAMGKTADKLNTAADKLNRGKEDLKSGIKTTLDDSMDAMDAAGDKLAASSKSHLQNGRF